MSSQLMFSNDKAPEITLNRKAVALISGGLDSSLAIHLVKQQGIEVVALHFTAFFSGPAAEDIDSPVTRTARQLDVPVAFMPRGDEMVEIIRNPRYGHGKNMNPCVDCRILSFKKAKRYMQEIGASFLVTGEVVGQRPMSQRRDTIRLIEKQAGCDRIVLRPLSARLLPKTLAEEAGLVDREQLLDIAGRGRKPQLSLAREIGLTGFSSPAGGCLLTDKIFSVRLKDLLDDQDDIAPEHLEMLKIGRHIRLRPGLKIVVSRREDENYQLELLNSVCTTFAPVDFPGPQIVAQGTPDRHEELLIGSILRRYSKKTAVGERVAILEPGLEERRIRVTETAGDEWIKAHMI